MMSDWDESEDIIIQPPPLSNGFTSSRGGFGECRGGVTSSRGGGRGCNDSGSYSCRSGGSSQRGGRGDGRSRGGFGGGRGAGGFSNGDNGNGDAPTFSTYVPVEKSNYDELFEDTISSGINFDKYDDIPVSFTGNYPPAPIESFQSSGLRNDLLLNVRRCKYITPTPVQKCAIPAILAGRDVMACAQTGSGKTAAFVLPMMERLLQFGTHETAPWNAPQILIISPTRELAIQIKDECRKLCYGTKINCSVVYGGTSTKAQAMTIATTRLNILVATPGRLLQFVKDGRISLQAVQFLVLDEADRMLDMGFLPDIKFVMEHSELPKSGVNRQTLMFSATFPFEIQRIANDFLTDYLFLSIGMVGGACSDVRQSLFKVDKFSKREKLIELIDDSAGVSGEKQRILIFVETKKNADFLAAFLSQKGYPTTSIHGDRLQPEREQALEDFKKATRPIMVATSVAARGLNIKDVSHVVNYDLPKSVDEYVHRIGRTGRMGNSGRASSFLDPSIDFDMASRLVKVLSDSQQIVPDWLCELTGLTGASINFVDANNNAIDCLSAMANVNVNKVDDNDDEEWG